jgi:hypothetical protein
MDQASHQASLYDPSLVFIFQSGRGILVLCLSSCTSTTLYSTTESDEHEILYFYDSQLLDGMNKQVPLVLSYLLSMLSIVIPLLS